MITAIWFWQFLILITSYFSPVMVAFIQNVKWPNWKKYLVSLAFHTVIAFAYLGSAGYINKDLIKSGEKLFLFTGMLFFYSILSYTGIWKPKGINYKAASFKSAGLRKLGLGPIPNPQSPSNNLLGEKTNVSEFPNK